MEARLCYQTSEGDLFSRELGDCKNRNRDLLVSRQLRKPLDQQRTHLASTEVFSFIVNAQFLAASFYLWWKIYGSLKRDKFESIVSCVGFFFLPWNRLKRNPFRMNEHPFVTIVPFGNLQIDYWQMIMILKLGFIWTQVILELL